MKTLITGMTMSGKTTFLKDKILPNFEKFVLYDPDYIGAYDPDSYPDFEIVVNHNEFLELIGRKKEIVFQPHGTSLTNYDIRIIEFEQICDGIPADTTLIVDEVAYITRKRRKAFIPPNFKSLIERDDSDIVLVAMKPQMCGVDFIRRCQQLYIFNLFPTDIKYLEDHFSIKILKKVKELKPYSCINYDTVSKTYRTLLGQV